MELRNSTAESLFKLATRSIILSQSLYPSNIGSTARAVGNMGFDRLVLVNPHCEVDFSAHQAAASAQKPLEDRTHYPSWESFFQAEGEGVLIGLCPRSGKRRQVQPLEETLSELMTLDLLSRPWYFVFGREDDGFSNAELAHMHRVCELPTFSQFKSLNVSQAALLTMFIFRNTLKTTALQWATLTGFEVDVSSIENSNNFPETDELNSNELRPRYYPQETIRRWIETLGFVLDDHRINAFEVIQKLILRGVPTPKELHMLECILQQNIRKLKTPQTRTQSGDSKF